LENARRRREVSVGGRGRWVVGSGDCRVVKLVSSEVRRLVGREREGQRVGILASVVVRGGKIKGGKEGRQEKR
jgi:hypothetical protein